MAQGFFRWDWAQGRSPHAPGVSQKYLRPRRHSPYLGRLRRRAINPTLPKEVKAWGGKKAPWGRRKLSNCQDAPGRICTAVNTAHEVRPDNWIGAVLRYCGICCSPQLTGKCGTRPFLWWVRAQGRIPHAPGICQKCLRPRRHSPY